MDSQEKSSSASHGLHTENSAVVCEKTLCRDADSMKFYGSCAEDGPEWHSRGTPLTLLLQAGAQVGRHIVALGLVVLQIYFASERRHLMNCDSRIIGLPAALTCEFSKGFVRYFPLLALMVSLMVVARMLLSTRAFYEILRRDALLDFENFSPLKDPLFRVLSVCIVLAMSHFIFGMFHSCDEYTLEQLKRQRENAQRVAMFYFVPTIVFLAFLWSSYDIEANLVPLSKYFEENPDAARRNLGKMPFIPEATAAHIVRSGLSFKTPGGGPCETSEVYKELISRAEKADPQSIEDMSDWRLVSTMWPAKLVLDPRLADQASMQFRWAWYVFSGLTLLTMAFIFYFFIKQGLGDLEDVYNNQISDVASLAAEIGFLGLTLWLGQGFLHNFLIPFQSPEGTVQSS